MLAEGESIEITKRNRVVGMLTPPPVPAKVKLPDFMGRMKKIYCDKVMKVTWAEFPADRKGRY
ncbi:MAG TPA: hypothetical protein VMT15_03010 [Bryobacteraceae bacterium]|nr:hypothetical protein [Bryobacteraceae bacterium]